jgi:hypothetical protein
MISDLIKRQPPGHPGRKALREALMMMMMMTRRKRRRRKRKKRKKKLLKLREVLTNLSLPVRNAAS